MNRLIQSLTDAAKHVKLPHRKPKEEVPTFYEDAPKPKKSKKGMKGASTEKSSRAKKLIVVNLVGICLIAVNPLDMVKKDGDRDASA